VVRRLQKDTNTANEIDKPLRNEDIFVANLYRQDTFVPGFTLQHDRLRRQPRKRGSVLRQERLPGATGRDRRHDPHTYGRYVGLNGDGHFGRWNVSASLYGAFGTVSYDPLAQQGDVEAMYAVAEVSRDFDWIRVRGTGLFQSGTGTRSTARRPASTRSSRIRRSPAPHELLIRQAVPLIGGGGVTLSGRNGVLPRCARRRTRPGELHESGLALVGLGADVT
jgi:hypothetical protein